MAATTPLFVLLPFIAYELLGAAIFARFIRRDRDIIVIGRYANALIETRRDIVLFMPSCSRVVLCRRIWKKSIGAHFRRTSEHERTLFVGDRSRRTP